MTDPTIILTNEKTFQMEEHEGTKVFVAVESEYSSTCIQNNSNGLPKMDYLELLSL